jgi:hypothetical protein
MCGGVGSMAAVSVAGVPLRFTACLISCAPTGLCTHTRFASLRGGTTKQSRPPALRESFFRGRKSTEKMVFSEEKHFFYRKAYGMGKRLCFGEKRPSKKSAKIFRRIIS